MQVICLQMSYIYHVNFYRSPKLLNELKHYNKSLNIFVLIATPSPYEQLLPLPTPCFKMFFERSLNDPHFKHPSLLPPSPSTTSSPPKNFDHTLGGCHPPTDFSRFSQEWEEPLFQTKFLAVVSSLDHLSIKKFSDRTHRLRSKIRQREGAR